MDMFNNYIYLVILFYIFYFFFFFLGRSFFLTYKKIIDKNKESKVSLLGFDLELFFPLIGVFVLGNIVFLINFIIPVGDIYFFIIFIFLVINFIEKINFISLKRLIYTTFPALILIISTYGASFHYDAGAYHLLNQAWFRESNIIFGFSNIYGAFGVSSLWDYVSSLLWFNDSFIFLHFLNILFILFFYQFIIYSIFVQKDKFFKNAAYFILLFSLLDNLGFLGGRNGFIYIQGVSKQDVAISVLYYVSSLLMLYSLTKNSYNHMDFFIISSLVVFIIQLKISGAVIAIIYFYYFYNFIKYKQITYRSLLKEIVPLGVLSIFWTIKSIIHSGCLIFPLTASCMGRLSWVDVGYLKDIEEVTVDYSRSYYFGSSISDWFKIFTSNDVNSAVVYNFFWSALIIIFISIVLLEKPVKKNLNIFLVFLIILNALFFLRFGPDLRYLMGFQMLLITLPSFYVKEIKLKSKLLKIIVILISIILVPRMQDYQKFNFFSSPNLYTPQVELVTQNNISHPAVGDQCWINTDCFQNYRPLTFDEKYNFFQVVYIGSNQ